MKCSESEHVNLYMFSVPYTVDWDEIWVVGLCGGWDLVWGLLNAMTMKTTKTYWNRQQEAGWDDYIQRYGKSRWRFDSRHSGRAGRCWFFVWKRFSDGAYLIMRIQGSKNRVCWLEGCE